MRAGKLLVLIAVIHFIVVTESSDDRFKQVAEKLGSELYRIVKTASGHAEFEEGFRKAGASVEQLNPSDILSNIVNNVSVLMNKRVEAVKRLVENAEEISKAYQWETKPNVSYYNAKETEGSTAGFLEMEFAEDSRFHNEPVNLTYSSIHVPTNIYNRNSAVLNGIAWSKELDRFFRTNFEKDPSLKTQYFGSADGFLRLYPGVKWPVDPERGADLYDCRLTNWYIRAASSPKDMVILVDNSGSMTGIREDIARATVKEIMSTLHEDDFFNVIKFKESPEYLDPCIQGLTQASEQTKRRFSELLKNFETENIANYTDALVMAFKTLSASDRQPSANCNKAIMIISDGAPESFDEIFAEYNRDKHVRVFTYVIGREVTEYKELSDMACKNRGYVTHVSTLADVRTSIEGYVPILSKPMVLTNKHSNIWTNSYYHARYSISVFARPLGLRERSASERTTFWSTHKSVSSFMGMVMTVAQPVFNRSASAKGSLIGVVGIDLPVKEIQNAMLPFKWGPGSYVFGVNHNGHVLFHPNWRQMAKTTALPRSSYNEIDISEVEFPRESEGMKVTAGRPYEMKLRVDMIDQRSGLVKMMTKRHLEDRKRAYDREYQYFYGGIADVPLSVGVAIPSKFMSGPFINVIKGVRIMNSNDLDEFNKTSWTVHPDWSYCNNTSAENLLELLHQAVNQDVDNADNGHIDCNKDLVAALMFDLHATQQGVKGWEDEQSVGGRTRKQYGVKQSFIATRAGLTRWKKFDESGDNELNHIRIRRETEEDDNGEAETPKTETSPEAGANETTSETKEFFQSHPKAVDEVFYERAVFGKELTIDPLLSHRTGSSSLEDESLIMAALPVSVGSVAAAVAGVLMQSEQLNQMLQQLSTETCRGEQCLCADPSTACYVVDESGFVVTSTRESNDQGKFFGALRGEIMTALVDRQIYKTHSMKDFQGSCQQIVKSDQQSCSVSLRTWWNFMIGGVHGLASHLILLMATLINSIGVNGQLDPSTYSFEGVGENDTELESAPPAPFLCDTEITLFQSEWEGLKLSFDLDCAANCSRRVGVYRVSRTNLLLISADKRRSCPCDAHPVSIKPRQTHYEEDNCVRYTTTPYRRSPADCFPFHEDEDSSECGGGNSLKLSFGIWCFAILITVFY